MINNFISHCYINDDILLIQFNTSMKTAGSNSILKASNYSIRDGCTTSHLSKYIYAVHDFSNYFVSFKTNPSFNTILSNAVKLEGGIIFKDSINYISSDEGYVCNFECGVPIENPLEKSSLQNCSIVLEGTRKLILTDNNDIKFKTLYKSDFFINVNSDINEESGIFPIYVQKIGASKYSLLFSSNISSSPDDVIKLSTISNPSSFDVLKRTIKGDDSAIAKNTTPFKLVNASIYSYENEELVLGLEFNAKALRFDINDFNISLNNKHVCSTTKYKYLNNKFCFITINNVCTFTTDTSSIKITTKNTSNYYTVDSRLSPISYSCVSTPKLLFGKSAILAKESESLFSFLMVNFDYNLQEISIENLSLDYALIDNSIMHIKFNDFGELFLYGDNLSPLTVTKLLFNISTYEKTLEINFTSEILSYITNQQIHYIDFKPLYKIKSQNKVLAFSSFEVPVSFSKENSITIQPDDFGPTWSLLGQDIYLPTIILVDKSVAIRDYGNSIIFTNFYNDLYIKEVASNTILPSIKLNFSNINATNLYTHLSDNYVVKFSNSSIEKLKILSEEIP